MIEHSVIDGAQQERDGFTRRLREALGEAGYPQLGQTQLYKLYNARSAYPVSSHAIRKWMLAQVIPRQHHIETLASWLACDAAWLRYGVGRNKVKQQPVGAREDFVLLQDLSRLDPASKELVYRLVAILKKT